MRVTANEADALVREISCDFVDRPAQLAKRTIHEITRNRTKELEPADLR
jgi:hypothetical protein